MESWRERGFVPDSDSEEEFDSQESQNVIQETEGDAGVQDPPASQDVRVPINKEQQQHTSENIDFDESQSARSSPDALDTTILSENEDGEPTPKAIPRRTGEKKDGSQKEDQVRGEDGAVASQELPIGAGSSSLSTPKPKKKKDIRNIPSSSPDELQTDYHPFRKQAPLSPIRPIHSQPEPSGDDNDDDMASPLSSPPSSLHSLPISEDNQFDKDGTQLVPERNLMDLFPPPDSSLLRSSPPANDRNDAEDTEQPQENSLENLLPPLEIPEDIMQELAQPSRRSLRQRNPIQMHPYLLEDAKYQSLMKARGVKPLRIAQYQEALRAAKESQGQEFVDNVPPPSSSPVLGLSSPAENSRLPEVSSQNRIHQLSPTHARSADAIRAPKRRRIAKPAADGRPQSRHLARPQVLIDNSSSPVRANGNSMHDVPPSPPRSGSLSPLQAPQTFNGFRFPRGFSPPPLNTPSTTSKLAEKDRGDDVNDLELSDGGFDLGPGDTESVAPQAERIESGEDEQDAEEGEGEDGNQAEHQDESAVRRFQRRIKGVLPASWLRLDQQKQQDTRLNYTQRANERMARMENTKGVAKKVTKNTYGTRLSPRRRLESLQDIVDGEDSEEDGVERNVDPRQALADLVGFDDPFNDPDPDPADDILEDNRIDYMFPATKRASSTRTGKQEKKQSRPEGSGSRFSDHSKRPRLKRQTRLTDPVHQPRREKKRSPPAPRLGILDAPDITAQPRSQQPQFLRVAARRVRSRQDRGRRSPTRKVFQLSTRADTEDANTSLSQWRTGRLRQTKLPRPQTKPQGRPSLKDLPTNRSNPHPTYRSQNTSIQDISDVRSEVQTEEKQAAEPAPTADEPPNPTSENTNHPASSRQRDQSNKWFVRRNVTVSSLKRNAPRPVIPEVASSDNTAFPSLHRSLSLLNGRNHQRPPSSAYQQNPIMRRFLKNMPTTADEPGPVTVQTLNASRDEPLVENARAPRRQIRKRPPQRLNVTSSGNQGTLELATSDPEPLDVENSDIQSPAMALGGLTGFQSSYSVNFNVAPLHSGTFFRESTFIGSGELARSLDFGKRDLDRDAGFYSFKVGKSRLRWGPWNDSVWSELGTVFDTMLDNIGESDEAEPLDEHTSSIGRDVYRNLIKYVTEVISFTDPIDRVGFVNRVISLVSTLNYSMTALASKLPHDLEAVTKLASYNLVLIHQAHQVARNSNGLVNAGVASEVSGLVKLVSKPIVTVVSSPAGQANISKFLEDQKSRELRESGARDSYPVVEAYIILRKILESTDSPSGVLGDLLTEEYSALSTVKEVECLETGWRRMFNSLPLNEIDSFGIVRVGSRFREKHDNWSVIKQLLKPVFQAKDPDFPSPISHNNYCRILFHRCHHLINGWGWRDCKPILDTLFDLFAKNTLYNLKPEENYTSPAFLDELDRNPSLEVQTSDPCFHIFLKSIGSGLRFLSKVYEKKKVRNITWRLLPNHGREYPKDRPIHQTDLDALRNHHDLLCTLYFAVPDGCRPRLETIKNLVDPARSHQETCNISLRSWSRLARFKLLTDEDVSGLEPFADWHCYFVSKLLEQHNLAREEVEAQNTGENKFSHQLIERTISQNQRQIESQLKTALNLLQNAIRVAPSLDHAEKLVSKEPIKAVLSLFNSKVARVNTTVIEALQVIVVYLEKCRPQPAVGAPHVPAPVDEDSQEFGDWGVFDALYQEESPPAVTVPQGVEYVNKVFHPAVSRLVSNCFGEDNCPEDAILLSVVDCWTSLAEVLVKHKLQHWDSYFSHYGGDYSWTALRSTMQTRKFTPKFLANCIEKDSHVLSECKSQVFSMWMSSLVERESILKFQHCLTEALLNQDSSNPILQNLPFSSDKMDGQYYITLQELRQRRVSLISSLLANMRTHVQGLEDAESLDLASTKQEYKELIQQLMSSMKANYQELGSGQASAQGEYVGFVHRVVGFLQQHTRDICLVDPFFTDPTSFPLPSTDPTYIVARLKGYEPKLSSKKVAKLLITFIQGVSERAAIDGQQVYLTGQLHASMMDSYESGDPHRPTLRAILLQAVFPAYLETAFSNPVAWVLCRPIINVISLTFKDLLFSMDTTDPRCVASLIGIFNTVFQSSHYAMKSIIRNVNMLKDPSVVITIASFLDMITSSLRVVDYIDRTSEAADPLISQIRIFSQFTLFATSYLQDKPPTHFLDDLAESSTTFIENHIQTAETTPPFFQEIRTSATRELRTYLHESWFNHQGKYYFTRRGNHQPQEIFIEPEVVADLEQAPCKMLDSAAHLFLETARRLDFLEGWEMGMGSVELEGDLNGGGLEVIDVDVDVEMDLGSGEQDVIEIQPARDLELPLDLLIL
ncbi:uncharacterized protein KD926_001898 [Aspergillus affinis]|uniref:uncharacterized protein n=1 Tax=Aspergillus affinis TaxID=1070780 RepID=UPI0022FEC6D6|nr:uncharacterized protein KD926_001898 [Aspergillus affinis]KAI9044075.1 hypothetical protein KD926_001898 [Aspergillus affinis]